MRPLVINVLVLLVAAATVDGQAASARSVPALGSSATPMSSWLPGISAHLNNPYAAYEGSYYPSSSTLQEGVLRGWGDLIRSQGEYNLLTSQAAINAAEARRRAIETQKQAVAAYYDLRQIGRDRRLAERGPHPTPEQVSRYAQMGKPAPLSPSEFSPVTGRLSWPALLQAESLAPYRAKLEELFARRAATSGSGTADHLIVRQITDQIRSALRQRVRDVAPQDYAESSRFLTGLAFEARKPASVQIGQAEGAGQGVATRPAEAAGVRR